MYEFMRFNIQKPVKIGEEYDVYITSIGNRGDGITKIENFIVFVPGTEKGEKCRIKIKEVANRFAIGEKIEGLTEEKVEDEIKKSENLEETS